MDKLDRDLMLFPWRQLPAKHKAIAIAGSIANVAILVLGYRYLRKRGRSVAFSLFVPGAGLSLAGLATVAHSMRKLQDEDFREEFISDLSELLEGLEEESSRLQVSQT